MDQDNKPSQKPPVSKNELRAAIEQQIAEYLRDGGSVTEIARGISGRTPGQPPSGGFHTFTPRPREERTYLPEVVAAIDARRQKAKEKPPARRTRTRLVRRAVYDDFGEPLRWEWVEEGG